MAEKKRVTTLIYLDEDIRVRLKYLALDQRISMAELIRRAIEHYIEFQPKPPVKRSPVKRKAVRS